jgi:stage III sporulation protein AG
VSELKSLIQKKTIQVMVIAILIIVMVVIFFSGNIKPNASDNISKTQSYKTNSSTNDYKADYETNIESRLEAILSNMKGVGKVKVLVTLETNGEIVPATDDNVDKTITNEKDKDNGERKVTQDSTDKKVVMENKQSGESSALILKEYKPKVKGVIVAAEGAEDAKIQYNICQAIEVALNIDASKVQVFEMKK